MKIFNVKKIADSHKTFLQKVTEQDFLSSKQLTVSIAVIIVFIFILRILSIQNPALDRTRWKEIDHITISKNYVNNGFNFFKPTIEWPAEEPRVTAMEFPLVPYLAAVLYKFFGFNVYSVRIITLVAFLLIMFWMFLLVKRELGHFPALLSALIAGMMPLHSPFYNYLFSEPSMIACSVFAIYYFTKWLYSSKMSHFYLSILGFTLAIALKLEPLYLLLIFVGLYFYKYRFNILEYKKLVAFGLLSIVLPIGWYSYAYYLTYHSIDVFGIFKGHDKLQTFTMLVNPQWYKVLFLSLKELSGGIIGIFLFIIGLVSLSLLRKGLPIFLYLLAIVCYFILVAEGNMDTEYRQLVAIPPFSVFIAFGTMSFLHPVSVLLKGLKINKSINYLIISIVITLLVQFKNYHPDFKASNEPVYPDEWQFSGIIKKYATPDSKLITLGAYSIHKGGNDLSPVLYYFTDLRGWSLQEKDWNLKTIKKCQSKGADLIVGYNLNREAGLLKFVTELKKNFPVLYENDEKNWIILSTCRTPKP